jgi:hypothetical protein
MAYIARAHYIKHQRCGRNCHQNLFSSRESKDIGSVQMGDLRLGILMQMEKAKWSAELW